MTRKSMIGAWSPEEYAQYLSVSRATVYLWLQRGWLDSVKIGGCRRILLEHDEIFRERFAKPNAFSTVELTDRKSLRHSRQLT